ncbi:hypothetical protein [uncultured Devosia sp.]|uniref:hypothetical protein n=1 Tax=uncultured Devosia sp. TaxID=211434 RepID=UPI0035C97924
MSNSEAERSDQAISVGPRMQGRVDAIDGGHVFGWAWHADAPSERLNIEASYDGKVIAKAIADRARVDLRRNGIGDGSYAFDLHVDGKLDGLQERLTIRAITATGEAIVLRIPSSDERAAEAAVAVPLSRVLERLDLLVAAQRQLQLGQRDTGGTMKTLAERIDALCAEGGAIETAVARVSGAQNEVAERVGSIEIFLSRFDGTLAGFDKRLAALQKVGSSEVKPLIIMLATMLGFVGGAVLVLFIR